MPERRFAPGFRFSTFDVVALLVGGVASVLLWGREWWMGFVVAYTVGHFFLFCNVVRLSRPPELAWAVAFLLLAVPTIVVGTPGWTVTILGSLTVTVLAVVREMRRPGYHGVAWKRVNPGLREWWEERERRTQSPE